MSRKLIIHKGETFACDNGHPYATALVDIYAPSKANSTDFAFAPEQGVVEVGVQVRCRVCGGWVWSMEKHHFGREELGDYYFGLDKSPLDKDRRVTDEARIASLAARARD